MKTKRIQRLNSLLKEVISEVVTKEVKNPQVATLVTVTEVSLSMDLRHAKVLISVIGSEEEKKQTIEGLNSASGFIAIQSSKKVVLRYFPILTFKLDTSVDQHIRIGEILEQIHQEKKRSLPHDEPSDSSDL